MKKKFVVLMAAVMLICMLLMTACGKTVCTVTFIGADTVQIVSSDPGFEEITAEANTFTFRLSKQGTYNVELNIDGNAESATVTLDKDGVSVSSDAPYDIMVGSH